MLKKLLVIGTLTFSFHSMAFWACNNGNGGINFVYQQDVHDSYPAGACSVATFNANSVQSVEGDGAIKDYIKFQEDLRKKETN
jgi:hypothetical protein